MKKKDLPNMDFLGKQEGEIIQHFIAKHWVVEIPIIFKIILASIIYTVIIVTAFTDPFSLSSNFIWLIIAVSSLALAAFLFRQLVDWMDQLLDVFILTDRRLISFDQEGLFKRVSKEMDLHQIEDAQGEQSDWMDNLFQTGHLKVANKSENIIFEIANVYRPHLAKRLIMDARENYFNERSRIDREREINEIIKRTQLGMTEAQKLAQEEIPVQNENTTPQQIEVPDPQQQEDIANQ